MPRFVKRRPSPAMVVALIALFVALGGGAYAVTRAAPNSVGSGAIINDAVVSADIKGGGGKTGTIKNRDMYKGIALFKGFATIQAGSSTTVPRVLNAGGQQTNARATGVQRLSQGVYRVTFNADPGTGGYARISSRSQVGGLATVLDNVGTQHVTASIDNSSPGLPAPTSRQVVVEVHLFNTNGAPRDRDFTVGFMTNAR